MYFQRRFSGECGSVYENSIGNYAASSRCFSNRRLCSALRIFCFTSSFCLLQVSSSVPRRVVARPILLYLLAALMDKFSSTEIDCNLPLFPENCDYPELLPMIPNTIEEYNAVCSKDLQDKCEPEKGLSYFETGEMYESLYGVASDICDENTLMNGVITENLRCLNETFENSPCYDEIEARINEFKIHLPYATHENDYLLLPEIFCLKEFLSSVCYINDIQTNCGELAGDMAKQFLRRSFFIEFSCDITDAKRLLEDLDRYKFKSHEQDLFVEILGDIINRSDE
ncbi:uncharacterized protein CDAR_386241 [Caerostris darwini]|uniref:DUF19 domain-containing protein n=1 Tax=Caerostris darwini TaxID=1538125 RepID=A0AAV4SMG0_9ARAC|nr:uncharacterized protein CDAR_386241 [Caerostris darwini]